MVGIEGTRRLFTAIVVGCCGLAIAGCFMSEPDDPAAASTQPTITFSPSPVIVAVGGSKQVTATARMPDGTTKDITSELSTTWASDDANIATVRAGLVGGVKMGTITVSATFGGTSAKANVTVTP
jgi:uncharacterized protein YjdB